MQRVEEVWLAVVTVVHLIDDAHPSEATAMDAVAFHRPLSTHGTPRWGIDDARPWNDHLERRLEPELGVHLEHPARRGVERRYPLLRHLLHLELPDGRDAVNQSRKTKTRVKSHSLQCLLSKSRLVH